MLQVLGQRRLQRPRLIFRYIGASKIRGSKRSKNEAAGQLTVQQHPSAANAVRVTQTFCLVSGRVHRFIVNRVSQVPPAGNGLGVRFCKERARIINWYQPSNKPRPPNNRSWSALGNGETEPAATDVLFTWGWVDRLIALARHSGFPGIDGKPCAN